MKPGKHDLSVIIAERLSKGKPWAKKRDDEGDRDERNDAEEETSRDVPEGKDRKGLAFASDLIDAVHEKDEEAVLEAIRSLLDHCS